MPPRYKLDNQRISRVSLVTRHFTEEIILPMNYFFAFYYTLAILERVGQVLNAQLNLGRIMGKIELSPGHPVHVKIQVRTQDEGECLLLIHITAREGANDTGTGRTAMLSLCQALSSPSQPEAAPGEGAHEFKFDKPTVSAVA